MSERSTVTLTLIRRIALVAVVATGFFVLGTLKQRLDCQEGAEVICAQSKLVSLGLNRLPGMPPGLPELPIACEQTIVSACDGEISHENSGGY